jgi:hypothetical protein
VAVMTAMLLMTLMGLAAFAVDVGHWYQVGQQEQAAADAAAMAGVTYLPGDSTSAFSTARTYSKINGFQDGVSSTTVTPAVDGQPTRLRVTVKRSVTNFFGSLLGLPSTTVARTAVADYSEPVPMGSPCNEFGNDPDQASYRATACSGVLGQFWANVNSPGSDKANGDAYQSVSCLTAADGCTGSTNNDYATDGYYYTVSVKAPMTSLTIQLFDPVFVSTGSPCDTNFGSGSTAATAARNDLVSDEATRYAAGASGAYCTGDYLFDPSNNTTPMNTQFTVRDPGTSAWDPSTFPVHTGCQRTYPGYSGTLFNVLNKASTSTFNLGQPAVNGNGTIVDGFRRWTTLCTITNPVVGDYLIQVKTKLGTSDNANASNHFAIRAYGSVGTDKESLSVFGREKMSIDSNAPGVTTEFHLARIPSVDAGQILNIRLFDVGDSTTSGTITVVYPPLAAGGPFTGCVGTGPASGTLSGCSFTASSTFNGHWESLAVPIPASYSCADADYTQCWVRLRYNYGSGSKPTDVTSWTTSIQGDPVRLVE